MSTPVLTASEIDTLRFLSRRGSVARRGQPIVEPVGSQNSNQPSIQADSLDCVHDPIQDDIKYHSKSVRDALDEELQYSEVSDAGWIKRSHDLALDVYKVQEDISKHWLSNQQKFMEEALKRAYSLDQHNTRSYKNSGLSCKTALKRMKNVYKYTVSNSNSALHRGYGRFRADSTRRPGTTKVWYAGEAALNHGTHHLIKWGIRRRYMYHQNWGETSNATYHQTRQQPDGIFQLMTNAQNLYADIAAGNTKTTAQKTDKFGRAIQVIGLIAMFS